MRNLFVLFAVFVCFIVLTVGNASAQMSAGPGIATDVAYAVPSSDASPGGAAEPSFDASGGASEAAQVKEALAKFTHNFELQDVNRLKSESWPSMSPKAYKELENTFATLSQITLQEDCAASPVIMSNSADWACNEKLGYQVNDQPRRTQTHALQFHLQKVDGTWYVEGRTVAGR